MATFRIHMQDGSKHDIDAEDANHARKIAKDRGLGHVSKVKIAGKS
jgi:hypothetical protein